MNGFNPEINYGPNDAGVSAMSIALAIIILIIGIYLLTSLNDLISKYIKKLTEKK